MMEITSSATAHFVAQIRVKQLATKQSQDLLHSLIVTRIDEEDDQLYSHIAKSWLESAARDLSSSLSVNKELTKLTTAEVGYPIKYNKTARQAKLALDWISSVGDSIVDQILKGKLSNNLENSVSRTLPILKSRSDKEFWGNENPSVSSHLLITIVNDLGIDYRINSSLGGATTFYKFRNYTFPTELMNNPFAKKEGLLLLGNYQFGGHRDFKVGHLLAPEDCSSSLGKAIGLTDSEVGAFTTTGMRDVYLRGGSPKLIPITSTDDGIKLELIQPGDLYLVKGHTALVVNKYKEGGIISTLQFSRDIDTEGQKVEGGGLFDHNLTEVCEKVPVYILRPMGISPMYESCSLLSFLERVDEKYFNMFLNGAEDVVGNCNVFL